MIVTVQNPACKTLLKGRAEEAVFNSETAGLSYGEKAEEAQRREYGHNGGWSRYPAGNAGQLAILSGYCNEAVEMPEISRRATEALGGVSLGDTVRRLKKHNAESTGITADGVDTRRVTRVKIAW